MSAPALHVSGGAGGTYARLSDLTAMAGVLDAAAGCLREARDQVGEPALRWLLADGAHPALGALLQDELAAVVGPFGALTLAADQLADLARALRAVVELYDQAESSVLGSVLGGLGHLAAAAALLEIGAVPFARHQLVAAAPGLADLATLGAAPGEAAYAAGVPDGHAVLHDLGPDTRLDAQIAPGSLLALVGDLAVRNEGSHGEISVSVVAGADGRRRAIVDVPGTKSWNPAPNHDVTSVGTDVRALAGEDTAYEDGVLAALTAAGVRPDEDVMLVGHSEGGIVAVNAARDAVRSGRFRVTHVVTAGSPVGRVARELPGSVQVLALENSADAVPHCDGADNPDRPGITTVTFAEQHGSVGADHDLRRSYEPGAAAADASGDPSIRAFTRSARGFLGASTMQTHVYRVSREF